MENLADLISSVDANITLAINSVHSPATDFVWGAFSQVKVWIPLYAIVVFFLFRRLGWRKALVAVVAIALTILACDQFANLIKNSVCRLRPCHNQDMIDRGLRILEGKGGKYGFFSGHAANTMAFAIGSITMFRWDGKSRYRAYAAGITLWSLLVGASRIFVGKHYFGDVITGLIAGGLIALLISKLAIMASKRWFNLQ